MRILLTLPLVSSIGIVSAACGEPPIAAPDAGGVDAASPDSGPEPSSCARDADCDDGLFCNGTERCIPGEPEADGRGCVVIDAPCGASECDETTDRCEACSSAEADRDGDGELSRACGGADCDDDDGRRFPGAVEACDAMHVDEDCDGATLHDSTTPGAVGDRDGDGHVDRSCANVIDGEEVARGDDCDDTDPAVYTGAPERCNGLDDDCDGMIDEDFDCVQSQIVSGTNACGRDGSRRCSESCEWLDDAFYRAESGSTCDYCDDSGDGLGEEIPFATETSSSMTTTGWREFGDVSMPLVSPPTWRLVDGASEHGGLYVPSEVALGYGTLSVAARVQTRANRTLSCGALGCIELRRSWSLVVLPGGATEHVSSAASALPSVVGGVAVTWSFSSVSSDPGCDSVTCSTDRLRLMQLTASDPVELGSGEPVAGHQDGPEGNDQNQQISIQITPDDPRTAADETAVDLFLPIGTSLSCANEGPAMPCGVTYQPGMRLEIGTVAASDAANSVTVTMDDVTVTANEVCVAE